MCGITFVLDKRQNEIPRELIERANSALRHRGPDDSGSFFFQNAALGTTRLSIVDIPGGQQPFFSEDQSIVLVCNGEIYNYRVLREQLIAKGHTFRSQSDCEVILHAYEEDPAGFVNSLDGMFSFVILDCRSRSAVLARDRLGIKPLFLFESENYFAASSEMKGIFALGIAPRELNRQGIYDFFVFNYIPGRETAFDGINHLPPGALLRCSLQGGASETASYWNPSFPAASPQKLYRSGPYAAKLREAFQEVVASHTIGDVPVASYLSGGIDSTITTLLLRRLLGDGGLTTFSVKFQDPLYDESPVFSKTAAEFKLDSKLYEFTGVDAPLFSRVLQATEQPQTSVLDVPLFRLSELVRGSGTKVVLSGEGSDELFGGYFHYTLNQIRRALSMPFVKSWRPALLARVLRHYFRNERDRDYYFRAYMEDPSAVISRFGTYPAWFPAWVQNAALRRPLFSEPLRDSLGEGGAVFELSQSLKSQYSGIDDFNKSIFLELKMRLPNYILSRADRNSMAHSVELRVPFLANRMIDLAASVPPMLKMLGLREKYILRSAFRGIVPPHVMARMKFGYTAPAASLWEQPDELRDEMMSETRLKKTGLFAPSAVADLRRQAAESTDLPVKIRAHNLLTGVLSVQLLDHTFLS